MNKSLLCAALAGYACAYSAHTGKNEMSSSSTKNIGIVQWQYFFDLFVKSNTPDSSGSNFDSKLHLCWF
jgi:hypothetical protein